jgi:hypothetical protein
MNLLLLVLALSRVAQAPSTESDNPLFQEMVGQGIVLGEAGRTTFSAPSLPDGASAAQQKAAILAVIGNDYAWEEFTRKSVVAPNLLKVAEQVPGHAKSPIRKVDSWFVVHGNWKLVQDEAFRNRLLKMGSGQGREKVIRIEGPALQKRKIAQGANEKDREAFAHIEFDLFDRVRISATGRSIWSKTAESATIAAIFDPRFAGDAEFPNQWRPLTKTGSEVEAGAPVPYPGGGLYMKITNLAEPAGAMFVEQHILFVEPHGWFDGANLLRSKLPPVIQGNVRNMRREWQKGPD